jgi:putative MATE family efflux protein
MENAPQSVTAPNGHLFGRKALWRLIWPLMIEQLLGITLGLADVLMVSTIGESAVSGISLVDTVFILINGLFAALATGGAVVCSQYIGRRRADMASKTAKQLIYTVVAAALIVMALGFAGGKNLLGLLFGKIDADVMGNAQTYFHFMLLSLPSVALYNGCAALFRAQGNSRVSMLTALMVNAVHIGGNALFLFVFHFGVMGVTVSTFLSRTLAAAVMLALLLRKKRANADAAHSISVEGLARVSIDPGLVKKILLIGIPNGLENSVFQLGKILVLSLIAMFRTSAMANTFSAFEVLPGSAIGLALLTVVGQCMGAGRSDEAVYYTKKLMLLSYIAMAALNIPLLLSSKWLVSLYGMSAETSHLGWQMLLCHGLFAMLFWPASFTLPNALRAAADVKYTMIASLSTMWIVRIGMSYVFALVLHLGALGVWLAMVCDWIVRDVLFVRRFARGTWKNRKLV